MVNAFLEHRSLLFGIAYRMLGSVAEAEDAVQDVYIRWQNQVDRTIRSAKAWLVATTTRLCIDRLRSARRQREEYFGVWLPEPLVQIMPSPEPNSALADSLGTAFLLMLETLTPDERAVFLLHEAFDYSHAEIAEIMGKTQTNCRQIIRRAKAHLAQGRGKERVDPAQAEMLVQQFIAAAREGNISDLLSVLASDATLITDGGGRVRASPTPIEGASNIVRFLAAIHAKIPTDAEYRRVQVNGDIGVIVYSGDQPISVLTFAFTEERIHAVYSVSNPDKLRRLAPAT